VTRPGFYIIRIEAAVLRNELFLMAGLNPEAHDIECCNFFLPAQAQQENQKISCGKRHFESLGVDYAVVTSLSEVAI
jgi:hypothetical protein